MPANADVAVHCKSLPILNFFFLDSYFRLGDQDDNEIRIYLQVYSCSSDYLEAIHSCINSHVALAGIWWCPSSAHDISLQPRWPLGHPIISKLCLGSWGLQSIRSTGSTRTASARKVMTCLELTTFPGVAGRSQISQTAYNCCFSQSS